MTKKQFIQFCITMFGVVPTYSGKTKTFYLNGYKYSYKLAMYLWLTLGKTPATQVKNIIALRDSVATLDKLLFKQLGVNMQFHIEAA